MAIKRRLGFCLITLLLFVPSLSRAQAPERIGPFVMHVVSPIYPEIARAAHLQGTVLLRVTIADTGKVTSAVIVSGINYLASEAQGNMLKWTFAPGQATALDISYEFRLTPPASELALRTQTIFDFPSHVLVTAPVLPINPNSVVK